MDRQLPTVGRITSKVAIAAALLVSASLSARAQEPGKLPGGGNGSVQTAAHDCQNCQPYPPHPCPQQQPYYSPTDDQPTPAGEGGAEEVPTPDMAGAPDVADLAAAQDVAAGPASAAPYMIGDFLWGGNIFNSSSYATINSQRRWKVSENQVVIPTDRCYVTFNHFNNAVVHQDSSSGNMDRLTLGIERTFGCGLYSWELRLPATDGLDTDQIADRVNTDTEFGNISVIGKTILMQNCCTTVAGGLGLQIPTGDDFRLHQTGTTIASAQNESVFLQPFIGVYHSVDCNSFVNFYAAVDIDLTGSDFFDGNNSANLHAQTLLYLDAQWGWWMYRDCCSCCCDGWHVTGVAPVVELHYTTALDDQELDGLNLDTLNRFDVVNLTAGTLLEMGPCRTLNVAFSLPLQSNSDHDGRTFDSEFLVQYNRRY